MSLSRRTCVAGVLMVLTGCASAPSRYYQMQALPGLARSGISFTLTVRSISIPAALDQNGIVKQSGDYEFATYSDDLWSESLADMLQAMMVQDLQQRLPAATVLGSGGSISAPADLLVEINVLQFQPDSSGQIQFAAAVAIKSGKDRTVLMTRTVQGGARPAGPGVPDIVAAMSMLWAQAADQITDMAVRSRL
jgi:uncharacterized lipoprotein YmbA